MIHQILYAFLATSINAQWQYYNTPKSRRIPSIYCNQVDCTQDASCMKCDFPQSCEFNQTYTVSCTTVKDCGGHAVSFLKMAKCRYCYQTDPSEYTCQPLANCTTTTRVPRRTICQVHPNIICMGRRQFQRSEFCNWSSGISWSKSMMLSILLGGFGADRFYLGHWKSAMGKLFSFGGLGIWTIVDIILIATGYLRPADGSVYI